MRTFTGSLRKLACDALDLGIHRRREHQALTRLPDRSQHSAQLCSGLGFRSEDHTRTIAARQDGVFGRDRIGSFERGIEHDLTNRSDHAHDNPCAANY